MELKKILIEAFDEDFSKSLGSIEAFINPDNYSRDVQIKLKDNPTINSSAPTFSFQSVGEEKLTLGKIIVDGTGVVVSKPKPPLDTVEGYIKKFRSVVCDWNGDIHSTPYLKITWGSLVFNCICSSVSLKYTLFKPDGTPLRAEITLTLQSTVDPETKAKMAAQNSPDLTHVKVMNAGQTLPLLTYETYGDSIYYLDVALKNRLNSVFSAIPGTSLHFPPLKK